MSFISRMRMLCAATLFTLAAACSSGPSADEYAVRNPAPIGPTPTTSTQSPTTSAPPTEASPLGQAYLLGNGDRLRITVFGEENLSGEFTVDGSGQISMPLLNEVDAAGISIRDLQRNLESLFREGGYLRTPQISAEVTNYRPYYIMGEVARDGEYAYQTGLTVLNAIAAAGGFTYRANQREVFIRGTGDIRERKVNLTQTLMVNPGDTIRIGERLF